MEQRRRALIVVNHHHEDPEVQSRLLPGWDPDTQLQAVMELKSALEDPKLGDFKVEILTDRPSHEVRLALETFFSEGQPDDLTLLIFSGQGIKGREGMLYFLTIDTRLNLLRSTALSAKFVNEVMGLSHSTQKIMILDCGYIGAFDKQEVVKGSSDVVAGEYFAGSGRIVLSAPQNNCRLPEGLRSHSSVIRNLTLGLKYGKADIDRDSYVSVDDAFEYLCKIQKPEIWRDPSLNSDYILAKALETVNAEADPSMLVHESYDRGEIKYETEICSDTSAPISNWKEEAVEHSMRYPLLDCPDQVQLNRRFSLFVRLLRDEPTPGTLGMFIVIDQDNQSPSDPSITVVLSADGFDIEGLNSTQIPVDQTQNSEGHFFLIPRNLGEHEIKAYFYQFGRNIGMVSRIVVVTEKPEKVVVKQPDSLVELQANYAPPMTPPPDLDLTIELVNQSSENNLLRFCLHTDRNDLGYYHTRFGEVTLRGSPQAKMESLFEEMSQMAGHTETDAEQRMRSIGMCLWDDLIPTELKDEYWRFKEMVGSMIINSDEPWIPWEIVKPYRYNEDNEREEDPFWCQQFALSRWLSGQRPIDELPKGLARPVAPKVIDLNKVKEEVAFIEQLNSLDPGFRGQTSINSRKQLLDLMERDSFSILHFATHGDFDRKDPNNSPILLSDGRLRPSDIQVRFGGRGGRRPRPLIFINACKGAQMGFSLTGLGGWAKRLINQAHVGVFAGAMWEVDDALALEFAKCFYTSLLQDKQTFAESFRIAREKVRAIDPSSSTWLAYVLYAYPEGRVIDQN